MDLQKDSYFFAALRDEVRDLLSPQVREFLKQARLNDSSLAPAPETVEPSKEAISSKDKKVLENKFLLKKKLQKQNLPFDSLLGVLCKEKLLQEDFTHFLKDNKAYNLLLCWLCLSKYFTVKKAERTDIALSVLNGFIAPESPSRIALEPNLQQKLFKLLETAKHSHVSFEHTHFEPLQQELRQLLWPFVNKFLS